MLWAPSPAPISQTVRPSRTPMASKTFSLGCGIHGCAAGASGTSSVSRSVATVRSVVIAELRRTAAAVSRRGDARTLSGVHDHFAPAVDHPLDVERVVLRIHHCGQTRILHYLGVDAIAGGARLVHNPGEHYGFARLHPSDLRERHTELHLQVVTKALEILQRSVVPPDLAGFPRDLSIGLDVLLWNRDHETVYVTSHARSEEHTSEL